jgi:hypothetical protein
MNERHVGEIQDANGSLHTPIYTTTALKLATTANLERALD